MVDKVVIELSPNATPEEIAAHDAAMAKVADENDGKLTMKDKDGNEVVVKPEVKPDGSEVTERPDDIPEKFWDAEKGVVNVAALLKSQQDGEAALRGKTEPKPDGDKELTDEEKAAAEAAKNAEADPKVVADATAEFAEKGELTPETYEKLDKAGLSKEMVDQYIAGQTAIMVNHEAAVTGPFEGSIEEYNKAADWAAENLSEDEIKALDVQLLNSNPAIAKQGAAALQEKYAANADIDPTVTIQGDGNPGKTSGTSYKSSAEMQKDMADARYKKDPAFRAEVAAKIDRSDAKLFG